jgi:hypothetical protein
VRERVVNKKKKGKYKGRNLISARAVFTRGQSDLCNVPPSCCYSNPTRFNHDFIFA